MKQRELDPHQSSLVKWPEVTATICQGQGCVCSLRGSHSLLTSSTASTSRARCGGQESGGPRGLSPLPWLENGNDASSPSTGRGRNHPTWLCIAWGLHLEHHRAIALCVHTSGYCFYAETIFTGNHKGEATQFKDKLHM